MKTKLTILKKMNIYFTQQNIFVKDLMKTCLNSLNSFMLKIYKFKLSFYCIKVLKWFGGEDFSASP